MPGTSEKDFYFSAYIILTFCGQLMIVQYESSKKDALFPWFLSVNFHAEDLSLDT